MSKTLIRWYKPQGGIYGDKDNHRDRAASGTAGSAGILTDQEQKKEREVKRNMANRCPRCGRFIPKGEPICDDCLEAIGRIIQEEVFPDSEAIIIKPDKNRKKAVSTDELERLFPLGGKSPDDRALHDTPVDYGRKDLPFHDDEEDDDYDKEELFDEYEDDGDYEDTDFSPFTRLLKDGVFVGLFVPNGKKKITIKIE